MADNYVNTPPPVVTPTHTEAEEAELQRLYDTLRPEANLMYVNFFLARTPANFQEDMKDLVEAGLATDPPVVVRDAPAAPVRPYEPAPVQQAPGFGQGAPDPYFNQPAV